MIFNFLLYNEALGFDLCSMPSFIYGLDCLSSASFIFIILSIHFIIHPKLE